MGRGDVIENAAAAVNCIVVVVVVDSELPVPPAYGNDVTIHKGIHNEYLSTL